MKSELNAHIYRKMKQAESNFIKLAFVGKRFYSKDGRRRRRTKYWARQYSKWMNRLILMPLNKWEKVNANL